MTALDKEIKKALIDRGKTQKWLIDEIRLRTGLYFDRSYYSKLMRGRSKNPRLLQALYEILDIKEEE